MSKWHSSLFLFLATQALAVAGFPGVAAAETLGAAAMEPVHLRQVKLAGEFGRRVTQIIEANILKVDVEEKFMASFRNRGRGGYLGFGKFLDATVRLSADTGDPRMIALKKKLIAELIATQEPGGYIGTVKDPQQRIRALWDLHENAYVIWALVGDFHYFGEKPSLEAARKMADYLLGLFAANPNLRPDTLGGVITFWATSLNFDRALLALSTASGDPKYRDFCTRFLKLNDYNPEIHCGPSTLANHAYTYMGHCLAQLDLYRQTGNPDLLRATRRALDFMCKGDGLLVTGSCSEGECWHETQSGLQNTSETCMAAYLARIMDSMLQVEGNSLYGDIMERDIYNALFVATSPDGRRSRYFTPFDGKRYYDPHGDTFCCANNNRRFLGDLQGWICYRTADGVAVNLYNASTVTVDLAGDMKLRLQQQTDYPTSGTVLLKVDPAKEASFALRLRIPRWCKEAAVSINGGTPEKVAGGRFHVVRRSWKPGDRVQLTMPMEFRFVKGRRSQTGRVAVLRGPVIYTLNPARNPELAKNAEFEPRQMMINPAEAGKALPDDSVRPGGLACVVKAWQAGSFHVWPFAVRVPMILSEYPDAGGEGIYFLVPDPASALLVEDELVEGFRER